MLLQATKRYGRRMLLFKGQARGHGEVFFWQWWQILDKHVRVKLDPLRLLLFLLFLHLLRRTVLATIVVAERRHCDDKVFRVAVAIVAVGVVVVMIMVTEMVVVVVVVVKEVMLLLQMEMDA